MIPFHVASLITFVDNEFILNQDRQNNHFSGDDSYIFSTDWDKIGIDII